MASCDIHEAGYFLISDDVIREIGHDGVSALTALAVAHLHIAHGIDGQIETVAASEPGLKRHRISLYCEGADPSKSIQMVAYQTQSNGFGVLSVADAPEPDPAISAAIDKALED